MCGVGELIKTQRFGNESVEEFPHTTRFIHKFNEKMNLNLNTTAAAAPRESKPKPKKQLKREQRTQQQRPQEQQGGRGRSRLQTAKGEGQPEGGGGAQQEKRATSITSRRRTPNYKAWGARCFEASQPAIFSEGQRGWRAGYGAQSINHSRREAICLALL
jgi:hypothetical protein